MTQTYRTLFALIAVGSVLLLCACDKDETPTSPGASGGVSVYIPAPDEFVPVDRLPESIYIPDPVYPPLERLWGIEGTTWVRALVYIDGTVIDARLEVSTGNANLDRAALDVAYRSQFKPGELNGQPVVCWVVFKVEFTISDD